MGKQKKKTPNRNKSPVSEYSPMKTRAGSSYPVADDIVDAPSLTYAAARDKIQSISAEIESFDNAHSPFFLHSSDHPGLSIVSHILDGTNYNNWSIAMKMSLDAKNKLSFVDGSLPRPEIDNRMFKIWSRCNSMVKAWMLNVVNKEIYDSILYYEDAAEMWNDLFLRFRVSNLPRKYQLEQSIHTLKQGNLDLSTYYTKKKTLWEQLANTRVISVKKCNCDHVKELIEEAETSKIIQFLMGLNDSFAHIRGQILNMKPRPCLTEIYNMLDQDESQRIVGGSHTSILSSPAAAFQVQASQTSDQSHVNLTQGSYQKPKCSYCHKLGHTADKCYKQHGYPPGAKWKKAQTIGTTNLAAVTQLPPVVDQSSEKKDYEELSNDQIQTVISYLSNKLHTTSVEPIQTQSCASTSTSVPVISQISGTFLALYSNSYYDMLISSISKEPAVSPRAWFPAQTDDLPLVQTSIPDAHPHQDVSSSKALIPSESKSTRQKKPPKHLQDFLCYNNTTSINPNILYPITNYVSYSYLAEPFRAFINTITNDIIPQRYSEAKDFDVWCTAMKEEIGAMTRTRTWSICCLPANKKAIGCKWVFTIKYNADGSIERYKARLVAKGYTQQEGLDYEETFSPVAKLTSVRMMLLLAAKLRWSIHQLDISNAFLNGDLDEEIYMKVPPGYADLIGEALPPNAVCRLHKSIYGLKQASRQWFLKLSATLKTMGFGKSNADHTLFTKYVDGVFLGVLVYVDDILIVSNSDAAVAGFIEELKMFFKLRDLGTAKYFLGLEIARTDEGISICQRKYILELLSLTGFLGSKPSAAPMDPSVKLRKDVGVPVSDPSAYRKLVGKLMYLQLTRPDIAFAVNTLCQFSHDPRDIHLTAVHKVLRYLKGTAGQGLFYPVDDTFDLRGYTDADWGTCKNNRRSVTGYCMFIGNSLVSWRSQKQDSVSMSSAESEFRAMSSGTKEMIWLSRLLNDFKVPFKPPAYLYCDNTAAIHIANNSVFHERTKHVELDCYKTREQIDSGFLKTMYVKTEEQLADPLTKALYPAPFRELIAKMGVCNIYAPLPS
ncbi:Retrotransposon gag domain [Arabidopsis suecica]|uniref:Retrotransposon gag domain n=1 Tax=Arabidopsis suecica TaxID=45249 RepID=A0A8T1YKM7_ARASU|nr:Retrotransposon gag domain [Arabidopsis suecica]